MTFSMSFPIVFRRTIGLKAFGELYNFLFGFGMMIDVETLKCIGQWPSSKQALAMSTIFFRHIESLMIILRCLHDSLFRPEVDELLHLLIALISSASEKDSQNKMGLLGNLFK